MIYITPPNFSAPTRRHVADMSVVTEFFPDVHTDSRGHFLEVLKWSDSHELPSWYANMSWIRQINRSSSSRYVIRGCHAQKGPSCQGKLVEAVNHPIYDIITDARPDSESFGVSHIFLLDPKIHNQLWVPRGFLHSVTFPENEVGSDEIILQYFCDNPYDKEQEVGVNPTSVLPAVVRNFKDMFMDDPMTCEKFEPLFDMFENGGRLEYSSKDINAEDYGDFMERVMSDYQRFGTLWYR